ncbi:MAG TPA: cytochrome c biogenesis heme-transporting ATPase CcmA [Rubrivivax sp.]|nr:cytochrome c biogenesis heme-transporting ATPase CcmA [Rubrivivax sp.]HPO19931.1 cytochrome c biogenesis heme-transporting ATPase CcmA [Rubrivivax sp.]
MPATSASSAEPNDAPPLPAVLELHDLACVRGRRRLFRGLNATLRPGQLLRVSGANGAGKTSLLRMLCGLMAPAQGRVLWQGQELKRVRDGFHRQLIYLGHAAALKDDLTPLENLRVAARLGGDAPDDAAALQALADAGLSGREHLPARVLSQGQRRRAALARLPLGAARLWVLDEPFNALDTAATAWLLGLIEAHLDRGGMVVLTSHQPVGLGERWQQCCLAL